MARHLSITMRLSTDRCPQTLYSALSSQDHFLLVSLAAIEGHEHGDHWFLCGYAFEDFLDRFLPASGLSPASVTTLTAEDGSNRSYLQGIEEALQGSNVRPAFSPFEKADADACATFLGDRRIGLRETAQCREWLTKYPKAVLYVYGSVNLYPSSLKEFGNSQWHRAFREFSGPGRVGAPFLLIRAGSVPLSRGSFDITLRTESRLWLEGHMNLPRLVAVVAALRQAVERHLASVSLDLEGNVFVAEEGRIRSAFSQVLSNGAI